MKKEIWKRMLCVATATVVCLTSIPGTVFADETGCKEAKDGKHVPNEDKKELVKMATCTEDGEWLIYCLYCNTQYTTEIIPATGHEWGDKKQIREAGCVTTGEVQYTCQNCNEVKTETTPAKGHTIVTDKGVTPTCTQSGLTEGKHCSVCNEVIQKQKKLAPKKHHAVTDKAVEATCSKEGLTEGKHCSVCNQVLVEQKKVRKKRHVLQKKKGTPATCTEYGWTDRIFCTVCNTVTQRRVRIAPLGHTIVTDPAVEATCTESGLTEGKHCSVCKKVITRQKEIPAKGHKIVTDPAVEATCTQSGLTEGKHCSVCKEVITEQKVIPAKGHTIVTDKAVKATCEQSGLTEGTHCSDCNEVIQKQETIAALGHEYIAGAIYDKKTAQVVDICKRCAKQTKRLANLVSLIGDEQNTKFEDMDGKEISSIPDNLKIFSGESEDGKRNLLYVNEKDEKQLREFSMLSEHKELNNLTLQFGKDENAGTIQMDAADGINQLGIRMKPYENGEVLIYVSEDIVNASIKNIKKNGNSIICETDNGSKLAISSDHMNYEVGKTDVPKKKDDSVLNQLVAKRVEGSEDTVEFSLQQVEEEQKDSKTEDESKAEKDSKTEDKSKAENESKAEDKSKTEDTAKTEDKSASEDPMEPIQIIFATKEMAKDEEEDEKKSQDDSTQIKMIEEDEPTQKIEKIKDEEPSIIIVRFVDPPVEEKKEEKEEEKQEEVKTVNFEFETLHTSCTISGYKYCSFKEVNDKYHKCKNKKNIFKKCKNTDTHKWSKGKCGECGAWHYNHTPVYYDKIKDGIQGWCTTCGMKWTGRGWVIYGS